MKVLNFLICTGLLCVTLSGCGIGGYWMNGNPNIGPSYPYGAHWIKEGMTREQRRQDSWACGAYNNVYSADNVVFSKEQRSSARLPSDQNDYGPDGRLTKQWIACMRSKDYVYLDQCDARCLYP